MKVITALSAVIMLAAPTARAALPTVVPVKVPSGEVVKFALPDSMCGYSLQAYGRSPCAAEVVAAATSRASAYVFPRR